MIDMKFRVGDIVTGKESADRMYSYTTSKAIMRVITTRNYEIEVQIVKHKEPKGYIERTFWVDAKHFTLIKSKFKYNYIEEE